MDESEVCSPCGRGFEGDRLYFKETEVILAGIAALGAHQLIPITGRGIRAEGASKDESQGSGVWLYLSC